MLFLLLLLALIIAIIAVIFAVQNPAATTVSFIWWEFDSSLALVLLLTFAIGLLVGILAMTPAIIRRSISNSSRKKQISSLETELEDYKKRISDFTREKVEKITEVVSDVVEDITGGDSEEE